MKTSIDILAEETAGVLIDTNVFVSSWTDAEPLVSASRRFTSSVVLQELFLAQLGQGGYSYALPSLRSHMHMHRQFLGMSTFLSRHAKARPVSGSADKIILDFAGDLPSRLERGHFTMADAYNSAARPVLQAYSSVLGKEKSRNVLRRYDALKEMGVQAIPLNVVTAQLGLDLFSQFGNTHNAKKDKRNTFNDMLILATAMDENIALATYDQELVSFAREVSGREMASIDNVYYSLPVAGRVDSTVGRESKYFVNNPWRAKRPGS